MTFSPQNRRKSGVPNSEGTQFKPGNNANPGGRPKGLSQFLRGQTKDGEELARWYLAIWRGEGEFAGARLPLNIRMEAAEWIANRGFGKPVQATEISGPEGGPLLITPWTERVMPRLPENEGD